MRAFHLTCVALSFTVFLPFRLQAADPILRELTSPDRAAVTMLGWDTEGGARATTNLLGAEEPLGLYVWVSGQRKVAAAFAVEVQRHSESATYRPKIAPQADLVWTVGAAADSLTMTFAVQATNVQAIEKVGILFPFDARVTPTTVLPSQWNDNGWLGLPAVINAPDYGQMLLAESRGMHLKAHLGGSREDKTVDFMVELPSLKTGESCKLTLTPVRLPAPAGLADVAMWDKVRRGWFGAFEPSARWTNLDRNPATGAPPGILANNVISDPASVSLWLYADQALWTPQITPDISIAAMVRRSVDYWYSGRGLG